MIRSTMQETRAATQFMCRTDCMRWCAIAAVVCALWNVYVGMLVWRRFETYLLIQHCFFFWFCSELIHERRKKNNEVFDFVSMEFRALSLLPFRAFCLCKQNFDHWVSCRCWDAKPDRLSSGIEWNWKPINDSISSLEQNKWLGFNWIAVGFSIVFFFFKSEHKYGQRPISRLVRCPRCRLLCYIGMWCGIFQD